jgi:hypothetical protein|tara:strand:+ start:225 stop:344 length:120 start_codon:yes stop_codon:yes gene_type:complete
MKWQEILKLKGRQKELDRNNDGKISGKDFEMLREEGEEE